MFPEFLFMMHCIIRSSVSLLNAAADSAERRADSDPICRKLAGYYRTHALEEAHHDDWLLDDLVAIGNERSKVLERLPSQRWHRLSARNIIGRCMFILCRCSGIWRCWKETRVL